MSTGRYVALLRGINVGGRNPVPMTDLRATFENAGFGDVRTYIQSGNVIFSTGRPLKVLESDIEEALRASFGLDLLVVVRSARQLSSVIRKAPDGFGTQPDVHHSDVVFLKAPLTVAQAMAAIELREDVDQAWSGTGVVYFQRLSARRSQSRLSRITGKPEYQSMTIRNWRTTTRLLEMVQEKSP